MTTTVKAVPSMSASELSDILAALVTIADEANLFGEMTSASISIETDKAVVVAVYEQRDWAISIEPKPVKAATIADAAKAITAAAQRQRRGTS